MVYTCVCLFVCDCWCRYVIDCDSCGVIYRSRQHWYGNPPPEQGAVRSENRHVWPQVCVFVHCVEVLVNHYVFVADRHLVAMVVYLLLLTRVVGC